MRIDQCENFTSPTFSKHVLARKCAFPYNFHYLLDPLKLSRILDKGVAAGGLRHREGDWRGLHTIDEE